MKISKRDSILLAIVGVIAILGGFYWFYVKPAKSDLKAAQAQVAQVRDTNEGLSGTLARLDGDSVGLAGQTAERIRLAKAVPDSSQIPAALVQLQRIADRTDVEFTSIQAGQISDLTGFVGRQFLVEVTGRFFDVDDFLYRLHNLVTVDARGRAAIRGRLFAVTKVEMTLRADGSAEASTTSGMEERDAVKAVVTVVVFSSGSAAAAAAASPFTSPDVGQPTPAPSTQPISAPTPPTPPTPPAEPGASAPPAGAPAGTTPTTASPGGTP